MFREDKEEIYTEKNRNEKKYRKIRGKSKQKCSETHDSSEIELEKLEML